jgi:hypothetical protein
LPGTYVVCQSGKDVSGKTEGCEDSSCGQLPGMFTVNLVKMCLATLKNAMIRYVVSGRPGNSSAKLVKICLATLKDVKIHDLGSCKVILLCKKDECDDFPCG